MAARIVNGVIQSPFSDFHVENRCASELIEARLKELSNKIIAVDAHQSLSASQLLEKIRKYAVGFNQHGVQPGTKVCAHVGNTVENVAAGFGVLFAGGTLVMAKPAYVERELVYTIEDSHCTFLLIDLETGPQVAKWKIPLIIKGLFAVGGAPGFIDVIRFQELAHASLKPHVPTEPEKEVVVILYTSGTTGLPKGVEISHKTYCAAFYTYRSTGICTKEDVFLAWNPFTHVSGFALAMFSMLIGAKIVITDSSIPYEDFLKTLKTFKVSLFFSIVGRMWDIFHQARKNKDAVPSVRQIMAGGSVITKSFATEVCEIFNVESLINIYGMTETFGFMSCSPAGQITYNHSGVPVAGSKFKVIDVISGESVGPYQNGEIEIHTPCVMKGYYGCPEATAEAVSSDGWYRTGDLGYYDTEGRIHVIERIKEMIKCMDNVVTPAELEELLMTHNAVSEAAVVGVPNPKYGEAPTACVVLKDCFKENLESLATELKELIAGQAAVFKHLYGGVVFMKDLPKSDNGKVRRQELKTKIVHEKIILKEY